jgi:hypothetical protein
LIPLKFLFAVKRAYALKIPDPGISPPQLL